MRQSVEVGDEAPLEAVGPPDSPALASLLALNVFQSLVLIAVVAHVAADLVLHVVSPAVLGRG